MNRSNNGFTIVELMLAMAFVSALLLAIAVTVIQIGNIYNKGITYKSVSQTGVLVANDLQQSFSGVRPFPLSSSNYRSSVWGGRLCTGKYSYIWNYGSQMTNPNRNVYSSGTSQIYLVKAFDPIGDYCLTPSKKIDSATAVDLINRSTNPFATNSLAIHRFIVSTSPTADDPITGQRLYRIRFILGTNDQSSLNIVSGITECKTPDQFNANPEYCAVNSFDFIVRAGNIVE